VRQRRRIRGVLFGSSGEIGKEEGEGDMLVGQARGRGGGRSKISASAGRFEPSNCKVCSDQERMSRPSMSASPSIARVYALIYNGRPRLVPKPGTRVPDSDLLEATPERRRKAVHSQCMIELYTSPSPYSADGIRRQVSRSDVLIPWAHNRFSCNP